jgi:hypothetical protein
MCDTAGRLNTATHQHRNGCRPTEHDSDWVDLCPAKHSRITSWDQQENIKISYLNALVTAKVEVKLCRVCDAHIYRCASGNVTGLARLLLLVSTE